MSPYTLQQEIAVLEAIEDWLAQSSDKSSVVSTIMANTLDELTPREAFDVLRQHLDEQIEFLLKGGER